MLVLPNAGWLSALILALAAVVSLVILVAAGYLTDRLLRDHTDRYASKVTHRGGC